MGSCHSSTDNAKVDDNKPPVALECDSNNETNRMESPPLYRIVAEISESAIPGGLNPNYDWDKICGPLTKLALFNAADVTTYLSTHGGVTLEGLHNMGIDTPGTCQCMLKGLLAIARIPNHIVAQMQAAHEEAIEKLEAELIAAIQSGRGWACEVTLQAHAGEKLLELRSKVFETFKCSFRDVLTDAQLYAALNDSRNALRLKLAISLENQLKHANQKVAALMEWVDADARCADPLTREDSAFANASAPSQMQVSLSRGVEETDGVGSQAKTQERQQKTTQPNHRERTTNTRRVVNASPNRRRSPPLTNANGSSNNNTT
jgi:hypothetical protein